MISSYYIIVVGKIWIDNNGVRAAHDIVFRDTQAEKKMLDHDMSHYLVVGWADPGNTRYFAN